MIARLHDSKMLTINLILLFITALSAGLFVFLIPGVDIRKFKLILTFSGAFLFSITVTHILPELLSNCSNLHASGLWQTGPAKIGIFILAGFFLQLVLEFFSYGVEHGHIPLHQDHRQHNMIPYILLISLCVHSLLEGAMLIYPTSANIPQHHVLWQINMDNVLYGIILHKIPAAFALMSVLLYHLANKKLAIFLLVLFALSSPLGMLASNLLHEHISANIYMIIVAIVSGSFLHISTTILFEASPDHRFNWIRFMFAVLGAMMAIFTLFIIF